MTDRLYTKKVSCCLNCPNFILYKQGRFFGKSTDPMACSVMDYKEITWDMIKQDDNYLIPDWCPLFKEGE